MARRNTTPAPEAIEPLADLSTEPTPESYVDVVPTPDPYAGLRARLSAPGKTVATLIEERGIQPVALASKTFASEVGPGGAANRYKTVVYAPDDAIAHYGVVKFHCGPLGEGTPNVPNGMADSTLLSILADRWSAFQAGPFASEHTGKALDHILEALSLLNARTLERTERGVQGKHEE